MTDSRDAPGKMIQGKFEVTHGSGSRIERKAGGGFMVYWRGNPVYENGRIKKFETEGFARTFLARCDAAGKIIH